MLPADCPSNTFLKRLCSHSLANGTLQVSIAFRRMTCTGSQDINGTKIIDSSGSDIEVSCNVQCYNVRYSDNSTLQYRLEPHTGTCKAVEKWRTVNKVFLAQYNTPLPDSVNDGIAS